MDSAILSLMSESSPSFIPYVVIAPPGEGYTLANAVAEEGCRVLMFCEEHLLPPQYRRFNEKMTVFSDMIDSDTVWAKATEVLLKEFDAIFFIASPDYWERDSDLAWPEDEILSFYITARASVTGKRRTLRPSGTLVEQFPDQPMALHVFDGRSLDAA
ncbi:hypothetical protein [Shinella sp. M27]|uniref:hypothetical protein n=1 Tax=Shinella sp. M27 TaxID=3368614 RepID=UPI003B9E89D9